MDKRNNLTKPRKPKLPAVFDDSGDEWSFDGLEVRRRDYDSDSDVDLVGWEDDDGSPAPGGTNDEVEEAQWTDHLTDFPFWTSQHLLALILTYLIYLTVILYVTL